MTNDKTREDFEAWAQNRPVNLTKQHDGMYESSVAAFGFRAYHAATQHSAARIAELEAKANVCGSGAGCLYKDARIEALEAEVLALRKDAERWRTFLDTRPANTHAVIIQAIDDAAVRKGGGV